MEAHDEQATRTVPCRVCREPIRIGARKCIHCQSSQGWLRHVGVSSSVLALLIALVTVLTASIPVIAELVRDDRSEVRLVPQKAEGLTLFIIATNEGSRGGTVGHVLFLMGRPESDPPFFPMTSSDRFGYVPAGATKQFAFELSVIDAVRIRARLGSRLQGNGPSASDSIAGTVLATVNQFDGTTSVGVWPVHISFRDSNVSLSLDGDMQRLSEMPPN
ncbi:MAG: hypothetical protein QOJ04_2183 [Caballeronia sp.]|jgi:hypothetical protein|nr:hypothetical protein [Caballeronia sp.]